MSPIALDVDPARFLEFSAPERWALKCEACERPLRPEAETSAEASELEFAELRGVTFCRCEGDRTRNVAAEIVADACDTALAALRSGTVGDAFVALVTQQRDRGREDEVLSLLSAYEHAVVHVRAFRDLVRDLS